MLAELLLRLGSFGLRLRLRLQWRVECDEKWDLTAELESRSAGDGMDTLTLLSLTAPGVQLIDAEAFAGSPRRAGGWPARGRQAAVFSIAGRVGRRGGGRGRRAVHGQCGVFQKS